MALTVMTLARVVLASAAGYAAARWLSAAATHRQLRPALPAASTGNGSNHTAVKHEPRLPREGGHPGRERVEYGASDRPGG